MSNDFLFRISKQTHNGFLCLTEKRRRGAMAALFIRCPQIPTIRFRISSSLSDATLKRAKASANIRGAAKDGGRSSRRRRRL
ncbi:hypothetical protein AMTR_s00001p00129380 [Amborella trichopoda]|uniref:Uncharacterized protein n=1 Tax=Amborella trichopoda TaxID=13333 RepID=W1NKA8_AMBTC|nr:hypothetical protein AMTR_s00001p00129380 [Amborella trichopoda]